jgi:Flp pilus assembly protein TadG
MTTMRETAKRSRRGQALVEFALIFSALMILLLGTVDAGRLYLSILAVDSAAAEGAAFASIKPLQASHAQTRAMNEGVGSRMLENSRISATVTPPPTIEGGQSITCTVTYSFTPMFPVLSHTSFSISRTAVATIMQ